ncbi:serine/arginine repetitive matrix protein [Thalictrum thalictroides]|uniref:Serine/arginine repetitive matrix protein n=1 Tax=Thalictrum thalictroides TaxID=46969 RepID=A0A7J6VX71_THATH|nr:serine/arginine repetitive matrix protein [Thalictrum thalictroides]
MAANSKADPPSCSPDRLTYPAGHRGAYPSASLSGSYRESMENRMLSSLPNMSRSTTTLSRGDVLNFFHGLPFDSKQLATGHKFSRQGDLNRVMTATVGISAGDLSSGSLNTKHLVASSFDELKRVKTSIHDNSVRARNRLKMLNETTSKFDKCFQNILPRKRSRSDVPSSDWENSLLVDRTVFGGIAKMGTQSQASAFDTETPKLEEKTKNIVPSKRTRTSLLDVQMDVRANALGRSHGSMERDREMLGLATAVQSEEKERTLVNGFDSWEKSRMKKKRSGIKSEYSSSTVLNRPLDGDQESKRDIQQRLGTDVRSRSSIAHGIRSGPSNGVGKLNVKTGLGMRSTLKNNQDNGSNLNDRRDHIVASDKERVNLKALNRSNIRENSCSSPSTKANTVTRAPRSGAGAVPKASANSPRSTEVADEWELSNSNKLHTAAVANNRKRTPPARSPSPSISQWAGQRPQKIPRVARRSNSVRPIVGHDETPALDTVSHTSGNDNGLGIQRRSTGNGLQQVKLKGDLTSSAALSESEESGAAEIKSKDKSRKSGEVDEKGGLNIPKVATQVMPSRKNKEIDDEIGRGGGVRRQGRTVRGFSNSRSGNPLSVEKRNHAVTAKQLRSARLSFDKNESKTGRPPTRKLSDRRAYTRPRPSLNAGGPDFNGESDDGHEELLVAANAAINSGHACSSSFWRQIEPIFSFVSAEDISYLKQQGDSALTPTYSAGGGDDSTTVGEGFGPTEYEGDDRFTCEQLQEHSGKRVPSPPSLYQRMLSAFIVEEEEDENFCGRGNEDLELDGCGSKFESNVELNGDSWNQQLLGNIQTVGRPASNGYRITATRRYLEELENDDLSCADVMEDTNVEAIANYSNSLNDFQPDQPQMPSIACTHSQYTQMSIDERLLLEVQSVGLCPDPMSEDDELSADISRLEEKLHKEVSKKTQWLHKLEKSVTEAREIQERDIERRAFDKLIEMAYEKYMTCWGPNAPCGKGISSKAAKQDALAFIKRTIERTHKFKSTSESCFNEAVFMDVFRSVSSLMKNAESNISNKDGESFKLDADTPNRLSEGTDSAPLGSHPLSSLKSQSRQNMDCHEKYSSDDFQSANQLSEQVTGKEDTSSIRIKRRELLLDDVIAGNVGTSLRSSLLSGAKGKRSERDREGKGHNRETQFRNGTAKTGRPFLGNAKGERKAKAKPKQRTTQLSASVNGLIGKTLEIPKEVTPFIQESRKLTTNRNAKKNKDLGLDTLPDPEALDLSHLQLPEMDSLGVPDDLGEQGQDLDSWLNIDLGEQGQDLSDDGLQDNDFMGLQIPMDDLSDLNMMV